MDALSLLNYDLTGVDSASNFPVLEPGVVDCVISDMKVEPAKKGGHNLIIQLKTAMPWKTAGKEPTVKAPGFPVRDLVSLVTTEKYNPAPKLKAIKEATLGDGSGTFGQPELYIGKPVTVRIKIESSEEYGDQNRVQAYVKRR